MPEAADILARLDAILAELLELRAAVAASAPAPARNGICGQVIYCPPDADDFAPEHLVEISTAVERFNRPADTLRYWCRNEACGVKRGGRWLASARRIERRLNGA